MRTPAAVYLIQRQLSWAERRGLALIGSKGTRGLPRYTATLSQNLFEPLLPEVAEEYSRGDGQELGNIEFPGKMQAVHSSSALACNVFHYWRRQGRLSEIAWACGLPSKGVESLRFEQSMVIDARFRRAPNLDMLLQDRRDTIIGIESKFCEPYSTRAHAAFSTRYFDERLAPLWRSMPRVRKLAQLIVSSPTTFSSLDAGQLVKHLLGLRRNAGERGSRLLYLFTDVPGVEGARHREELDRFSEAAVGDGIDFSSLTYQDLILRLAAICTERDSAYLRYVTERYL